MSGIVDFNTILHTEDNAFVNVDNPLPVTGGGGSGGSLNINNLATFLKPLSIVSGNGSNRLSVDVATVTTVSAVSTVSTVSTVNSVTNVAQIGGVTAFQLAKDTSRIAYSTGVRSKLSL